MRALSSSRTLLLRLMLAVAVGAAVAPTSATARTTMGDRIHRAVASQPSGGVTTLYVWDAATGQATYARRADARLAPASTMKLLTGAAALAQWGADHRFRTRLLATGRQEGDAWLGSLYLVGGGDPMLSTAGFARDNYGSVAAGTNVASLVAPLRRLGIRRISGHLVVVDDALDTQRWVREWPRRFRLDEAGALGALTVNQSRLGRWASAGRSTSRPDLFAGLQLRTIMARSGITVVGRTAARALPPGAQELAAVDSPRLGEIVRRMDTNSDNFIAEMLLKNLGAVATQQRGGSTASGRRVAMARLRDLGVDTRRLTWVDGSGLAYGNRVTARLLAQLLDAGSREPWGPEWINGFALSGRTGTLRHRMRRPPYRAHVRAKTGTLRHVSALAGFAQRPGSPIRYGFVVLTNQPRGAALGAAAKRLEDRVAMTLVH